MMYLVISIVIMALVTYIPRWAPLVFFNKKIESNYIKSLLHYMPYTVLASMTFPAIFYSTSSMVPSVIGTVVAVILAYFEKSLIVVASVSVLIVYIVL